MPLEINQIYLGDCLEKMKDIEDGSVDLIVTDPPYRTITGGDSNGANSVRPKGMLRGNRKLFTHQNDIRPAQWIPDCYRVLKEQTHCYIFTNCLNLKEMLDEPLAAGFKLVNLLVWEKNNCTPSQYYMKNCEYVLFLRKGRAKYINDIGGSKTVHQFQNLIGNKQHPTEKPAALVEFYINNSSTPEDIVFDPFLGSGTTAVAAIRTGRNFIGFEKEKQYYDVARKRILDAQLDVMLGIGEVS